ncbi:hypothetical protein H0H81_001439 [Sphagnurus paluster]|uniref:Association with the SNF1 complex (ASC) domain-containing protein n=1 Tax=Sphagnurus paluster TaxID=117069 RepID=A0A9P7FT08_9AGAR|nr:hypothetical protein H0H81_001439 [Sphagnurus paluster]
MGNAASQTPGPRGSTPMSVRARQNSTSPSPGNPHSSLRTKKKSLELPDLASLTLSSTRGRQQSIPPKSASIPIPAGPQPVLAIPGEAGRTRAPITLPSNADVQELVRHEPPTHQPFPPPSRTSRSAQRRQNTQQQRIQELYNQSQAPPPRQAKNVFVPETVISTIPIALTKATLSPLAVPDRPPELVPVKITWTGGGRSVFLARAGDDDWKGRLAMTPESPRSQIYHATVSLPPGTHHIRFLIDDLWRVADDLPTAVDDQGSLANYVAVPITFSSASASPPAPPPPPSKPKPGQSFWSAASSTDDDDSNTAPTDAPNGHDPPNHHHHHHHVPKWTNVLPPELIEAAREEEAYLAASEPAQGTHRVAGFVPAPNIPPAPGLPRHLDKLILNARAVTGGAGGAVVGAGVPGGSGGSSGSGPGRRRGEGRYGAVAGASNSVGGRSKGRERERERRDREERDESDRRRYGGHRERKSDPPPPPPPSETGTLDEVVLPTPAPEVEVTAPVEDADATLTPVPNSPDPNANDSSAPESPAPSEESTPVPTPFVPSFLPPASSTTPAPLSLVTSPPASTTPASTPTPTPTPTSRPLSLGLEANTPALTDDGSVLPVPSHVVLHHLSTSAIRNGVLAVGNTTRYRKKYLTTIYYKPT